MTRREDILRTLSQARAHGGMTLLVDGFAGMGKTFLLRELEAHALQPVFMRADEFERWEPYSFIERFISSGLMPDWWFLPDATTQAVEVARECIRRLIAASEAGMQVIIIDDAQWIDEESQRVLRYLIPRVTRRGVMLAFGARSPHESGSFGEFLTGIVSESRVDERITLHPLTTQEVRALVLERAEVGVSVATAQQIVEHTEGSFLAIDSMLSSLTPHETAQLHLSWNPTLRAFQHARDPLLHQFSGLSAAAQTTCEVVCLASHEISRGELTEVLATLHTPLALDEALDAGVLILSGVAGMLLPRHALVAEAIAEQVPPERATGMFRALAQATHGYRSLRHTLLGSREWDAGLREEVTRFVEGAAVEGKLDIACEVLRAALAVATQPEDRAELLESLTLMHLRAKNAYLVLDLFDEISALPHSVLHEFMVVVLAAHRVGEEIPHERAAQLLATPTADPDEQTVLAFGAFMAVMLTMRSLNRAQVPGLIEFAKQLITRAPANPAELHDTRLSWMVARDEYLLLLDCYRMVQDQYTAKFAEVHAALPRLTERALALPEGPFKVDAFLSLAGAYLSIGEPQRGRELAQQGVDLLERVSEPWAASTARVILADCFVMWGEFDRAAELIALAEEVSYTSVDVETRSTWAALRVIIAAATGDKTPTNFIDLALRQRDITWEGYGPDLGILAACELARARGDAERVLQASSGEWVERIRNTRHGFLTYRAHALLDLQRLDEAEELITGLAAWRGTQWQEYWGSLHWLRARLAQLRGDDATALWHYETATEVTEFPLPRGLTLMHFGEFLIARGDRDAGLAALHTAFEVLEQVGAEGYLVGLREALADDHAASVTPHRKHLLTTLTERERQIAWQLAKGRSNNQIAESLIVSVTTVRSHVSNVLRKLKLSSRGEVAKLLRDSDELPLVHEG